MGRNRIVCNCLGDAPDVSRLDDRNGRFESVVRRLDDPMRFRLLTLLIVAALIPPLGYAFLVVSGSSGGRGAFSPDTLAYRVQSEVLLYGTTVPVFQSRWRNHDHELVKFLIDMGHWKPAETNTPRWLFLFQSNSMWRDGESSLHRAFFWKREFWIEWTNKHPKQAAAFWPCILDLQRSGDERQAIDMLHEVLHSP